MNQRQFHDAHRLISILHLLPLDWQTRRKGGVDLAIHTEHERCRLIGLILFSVLFLPTPAFSANIDMDYTLGFDGYFRLNHWTPVTIRLENRGRSLNGQLDVVVTSGSELLDNIQQTIYSMDVELPTHSNKLHSFSVLLDSFAHPLTIRLTVQGEPILSETLNLRSHYTTKPIILVSGDKVSPDDLPVLSDDVFPIFSYTRSLPETWYGYDGVALLILHADVLKTLRPEQFQALVEWIRSGGYVMTASGLNTGSFSEPRMEELMPAEIHGFEELVKIEALKIFCGSRLESQQPFLVLNAEVKEADVLIEEEGIPLLVRKQTGAGQVMLLGIDVLRPPFRNWRGRHAFWQKMTDLAPGERVPAIGISSKTIRSALLAGISTKFPQFIYVLSALGIYLLLLKICFFRIEKKRRLRSACIALTATILLFSMAALGLYLYQRDEYIALSNSFLRLHVSHQHTFASGHYTLGFYGFQQREHRIRFPRHHPVIFLKQIQPKSGLIPGSHGKNVPTGITIREDDSGQELVLPTEKWSAQFLQLHTILTFPIQGHARFHQQNLELHIENHTSYTLTACWFYFDEYLFPLGTIPSDTRGDAAYTAAEREQAERLTPQTVGEVVVKMLPETPDSLLDTTQRKLLRDMLHSLAADNQVKSDSLYVFGWIDANLIPVTITSADVPLEGVTLVEWEIPLI